MGEYYLLPQSNTAPSPWVPFGAGTGLWDRLNDAPGNLSMSYAAPVADTGNGIASSLGGGDTCFSFAGAIPANDTVTQVQVRLRARNGNAASPSLLQGVSVLADGVEVWAQEIVIDSPDFRLYTIDVPGLWTPETANGVQVGLGCGQGTGVEIAALEVQVSCTVTPPTGDFAHDAAGPLLSVDGGGVEAAPGHVITYYLWNWGDGTTASGAQASRRYAAGGRYTVTLTVIYDSGDAFTFSKEVSVAILTSISPLMATCGAGGNLITLTGGGFGAGGTVTIGGTAATTVSWGAAQITCRAGDGTPLGAQTVTVTTNEGATVTAESALFVYDPADGKDVSALTLGIVDAVYLDGKHVGFTSQALDIVMRSRSVEFEPADRFDVVQDWTYTAVSEVRVTLNQLHADGATLAKILGGSYNAATGIVSVAGNSAYAEHSLAVVEACGVQHVFRRVKVAGDIILSLNKEVKAWPVTFKVLSLNDGGAKKYECWLG